MDRVRALAICAAALLLLASPAPARATLIGTAVDVALLSPGDGLSRMETVVVNDVSAEIQPGSGPIRELLLSTEFIDFDANRITIRLEEGVPGGSTGYAPGARYVFSNLYTTVGLIIDDVAVSIDNLDFGTSAIGFGRSQITVPIDEVVIGEIPGIDFGTLTLDITAVVPEPTTALLLLGGLAALAGQRRRHSR